MGSEREAAKAAFLAQAGLSDARREPLPGDASTRRYERLFTAGGTSLMLMDAPPSAESPPCAPGMDAEARRRAGYNALARLAAGRVDAFAACAGYLRERGLSAPEIVALDAPAGLAVTEDLGDGLFARLIERGAPEANFYFAAVDALALLHAEAPPAELPLPGAAPWPLLAYDDLALKTGCDLLIEWLPGLDPRVSIPPEAALEWDALWAPIRARGEDGASVFTHRDYHAENLMWLPDRSGAARVGMVDFQDAVRAHPSWDLHSLLQDARRDVSPELEHAALGRYFAARPHIDRDAFLCDYSALAALNEARIIGVFARLITRDAKPRYRAFLPRMWRQLERNLRGDGLGDLKAWFDRHVPAEARG